MSDFHLSVGEQVTFSKTVGESDVYLFAGITGDLNGLHVNEQFMSGTAYGQRIAHGALLVGFMSTTSTMMIARSTGGERNETPVSLGYERIRFIAPVYINDTVSVTYTVAQIDEERRRALSDIEVVNQRGETVAVAQHIIKWVAQA